MTCDWPSRETTMEPTWPSLPGPTTKSSGATGFGGAEAQPATRKTRARAARAFNEPGSLPCGLVVHLDDELGAAHAHHGRRGADLHRLGRLLDHLARHRGELALLERALELPGVGGGVERVL